MRRLGLLLLVLVSTPAMAGHHHCCLGHHWMSEAYSSELYFQLQVILGVAFLATLWSIVSEIRRKRRCG